jgi:hypothetical protein
MSQNKEAIVSTAMPEYYDRQLGSLHGLPDVVKTRPATIRVVPPLGIGGTQVFIVQTYRQREQGDMIFLEMVSSDGAVRLVIPPQVSSLIARQRDSLTSKTRSRAAKASADERAAQGIKPAFARKEAKS